MADKKQGTYSIGLPYQLSSTGQLGFERQGYEFKNWEGAGGIEYHAGQSVTFQVPAVDLTAKWDPIQYAITYQLDGGTNNPANPAAYTIESADIVLQPASKDKNDFVKWVDNDGNQVTRIQHGSIGDKALSAIWKSSYVDLTYDTNYQGPALVMTSTNGNKCYFDASDPDILSNLCYIQTNYELEELSVKAPYNLCSDIDQKDKLAAVNDYSDQINNVDLFAFVMCSNLSSVNLPVVTAISAGAFYECPNLFSVNLPKATIIDIMAFSDCPNLSSVNLPNVTTIGDSAFSDCSSLSSANLPNITTIGDSVFYRCHSLSSVDFPAVTSIGNSIFYYCYNLSSVNLPNVTTIGDSAFSDCSNLISVSLPDATIISSGSFIDCFSLTSANLPATTLVDYFAFGSCSSLTSVNLPAATIIGSQAFVDCSSLSSVNLPKATIIGNYTLGSEIGGYVFNRCSSLISVNIPLATSISYGTFLECNSLSSVVLSSVTVPPTLGGTDAFGDKRDWPVSVYIPYGSTEQFRSANTWPALEAQQIIQFVEI